MDNAKQRVAERKRRASRIRRKISGTGERPRLSVRRSLNHIYAQIIDDLSGKALVQVGSTSKELKEKLSGKDSSAKTEVAKAIGELVAQKAKDQGITTVVFDRRGYRFHGRVKALADAARGGGLTF